jgi:hypothetical protein
LASAPYSFVTLKQQTLLFTCTAVWCGHGPLAHAPYSFVTLNNRRSFILVLQFGAAMGEHNFERAVRVLEPLQLTPETEAQWMELSELALANNQVCVYMLLLSYLCSCGVRLC